MWRHSALLGSVIGGGHSLSALKEVRIQHRRGLLPQEIAKNPDRRNLWLVENPARPFLRTQLTSQAASLDRLGKRQGDNFARRVFSSMKTGGVMSSERAEGKAERAAQFIVIPIAIAFGLWLLMVTWTAFFGGKAPLFPYEFTNVNIIRGLLWLIIVDPILVTIGYWAALIIVLPIAGLVFGASSLSRRGRKRANDFSTSPSSPRPTSAVTPPPTTAPAVMPARIGAVFLSLESDTGPGQLLLAHDGQAVFRVTNGPRWDLGNLHESVRDYRVNDEGRVSIGFKPPLPIMMWAEREEVPALIELLESSAIPHLRDGDPLPPL